MTKVKIEKNWFVMKIKGSVKFFEIFKNFKQKQTIKINLQSE